MYFMFITVEGHYVHTTPLKRKKQREREREREKRAKENKL
jgi:hypothetical protein